MLCPLFPDDPTAAAHGQMPNFGAEVYFKTGTKTTDVEKVMASFRSRGLDGFTLAVDPRAKVKTPPGPKVHRGPHPVRARVR